MAKRDLTMGVDLGTTSSSAGVFTKGQIRLAWGGAQSIPSAVHVPTHGEPLVGTDAARQTMISPRSTVLSVKRLLGGALLDPVVKRHAALAPYTVFPAAGARLQLGLETGNHSSEQIAGQILVHLRTAVERRFAANVRNMVIAVPSTSGNEFERSMARAASVARLKIVEMIPEPVAGALGLGLHLEESHRRLLVCDFGGGSFDVAAIACGHGRLDVLATSGDRSLGGEEFTDALVDGVLSEVFGCTFLDVIRDAERYQKLLVRTEPLKRLLGEEPTVTLRARDAISIGGELRDIEFAITREWAEKRWQPLVSRAIGIARRTLEHVNWLETEFDGVVLLGGAALTPMVQRRFLETFGSVIPCSGREAQQAVVRGLVLRSSQFTGARGRRATRALPPPPPRSPDVPDVVEPNMAATARIAPIRF